MDKYNDRQYCERVAGDLKMVRSGENIEPHWKELCRFISPRTTQFLTTDRQNAGAKMNQSINNGTATFSVRTMSNGFQSNVTSATRPWFQILTNDPTLNDYKPVKQYLDYIRQVLADMFIKSNIYSVLPEVYSDLAIYGTSAFSMVQDEDEDGNYGLRCYHYPVGSYYIGTSNRGVVNSIYRELEKTVGQLVDEFGLDNCSENVKNAYKNHKYYQYVTVGHLICPNREYDKGKPLDEKKRKFLESYWEIGKSDVEFLRQTGYHEFPVMAPRWGTIGENVYGYSPGMEALPDIKQLQLETKKKTMLIEKGNSPPMGAPSTMRNEYKSLIPGEITYYNPMEGAHKFEPIYTPDPGWLRPLIDGLREIEERIKRAFFENMFLMLANDDRSGTTAREIDERHQEKVEGIGPVLVRMNDELYDRMVRRGLSIADRIGLIPPPPPEMTERGATIVFEYTSVMHQAMKMTGIAGIERLMRFTFETGQQFPEALDVFDGEAAVVKMADALGTNPDITRSEEERAKIRQDRQRRAQMQDQLAIAQQGAETAKTMSETSITEPSALQSYINYQMTGTA